MRNAIITIDARPIRSSGIGTCLVNLVPRILAARSEWSFRLLGRPDELSGYSWSRGKNIALIPFEPSMYTVGEQLLWPAGSVSGSKLFWSPHYNIPLRWRGGLLVTVHDLAHLALPRLFRKPAQRAYATLMFQAVRWRADAIHFDSAFTQSEFARLVGPSKGRSRIVHNGVDEAWFRAKATPGKQPRPYVVYVGNVKPHKNLRRLLLAFERLPRSLPHDLLIVGRRDGFITGDENISDAAKKFGERVVFTGFMENEALRALVAGADALVLPSYYEGFGLPPIEAMACGCPVLVAEAASLPEICGDAALYCNPFDVDDIAAGLVRILTDQALRAELRGKGRVHAASFTWEVAAEALLETMDRLVKR